MQQYHCTSTTSKLVLTAHSLPSGVILHLEERDSSCHGNQWQHRQPAWRRRNFHSNKRSPLICFLLNNLRFSKILRYQDSWWNGKNGLYSWYNFTESSDNQTSSRWGTRDNVTSLTLMYVLPILNKSN